jgi:hypothetical protein
MMGLTVTLSHCPNPDIKGTGYWEEPVESGTARHVLASSLKRAQQIAQQYIDRNGLGGGNWTGGALMLDGKVIGHISYNGRAWHNTAPREPQLEMSPADPVLGSYACAPRKPRAAGIVED